MPDETKEEAELIDAVEKKLAGHDLAETMASAIRGELSKTSIARRILNLEDITPPKE